GPYARVIQVPRCGSRRSRVTGRSHGLTRPVLAGPVLDNAPGSLARAERARTREPVLDNAPGGVLPDAPVSVRPRPVAGEWFNGGVEDPGSAYRNGWGP